MTKHLTTFAVFLLLSLTAVQSVPAQVTITTVAISGDTLPDSMDTFTSFSAPFLNSAGQMLFRGYSSSSIGLFRSGEDGLVQIALTGQAAPSNNGNYKKLGWISFNEAGQVAFQSDLSGGSSSGLFRGNGVNLLFKSPVQVKQCPTVMGNTANSPAPL